MNYAIGIDLGGTKIEGIIANDRGRILKIITKATERHQSKRIILENISLVITSLLEKAKKKKITINGIGVGIPGQAPGNQLRFVANVPSLEGVNLKHYLEKKFKKKIIVENDAACFALAESCFGAGKNKKIMVGIIWGTGLGCGIVLNGKISYKLKEPGHIIVNLSAKVKCGCGKYGDFESFTSAPNLVKYYKLFNGKNKKADSLYIMSSKEAVAKKVRKQALHYFCRYLAFIANLLNPEIIVLGGGISNNNFYGEINRLTNSYVGASTKGAFKIIKYRIKQAGALGAAILVFD